MSRHSLDLSDLLIVGLSTRIHLVDEESNRVMDSPELSGGEFQGYHSRVLKLLPDGIVTAWPMDLNTHVPVNVGQGVVLEVKNKRGVASLSSHVIAKVREPIAVLHIAKTDNWSWKQHRLSVRLDVSIIAPEALLVRDMISAGTDGNSFDSAVGTGIIPRGQLGGTRIETTIRDLSAGGVLLASPTRLVPGALLRINFSLGKGQSEITAMAKVVWVGEDESARRYRFKAGCQFLDLRMGDQDRIVKFIFSKQAEQRRWGLI